MKLNEFLKTIIDDSQRVILQTEHYKSLPYKGMYFPAHVLDTFGECEVVSVRPGTYMNYEVLFLYVDTPTPNSKLRTPQEELELIRKSMKPCPFCGKEVTLNDESYGTGNCGSGKHAVICCKNCSLKMVGPDTSWTNLEDHNKELRAFVSQWNTRVEEE